MSYTIGQIEDAILSTLNAAPISAYKRTLTSYQGELEGEINQIILTFPAIFVAFLGAQYATEGNRTRWVDTSYLVIVCDQNLRGNSAARKGAAGSIGTYQMLADVRGLLLGSKAGLNIAPFILVREEALHNDKTLSMYTAEYSCGQGI